MAKKSEPKPVIEASESPAPEIVQRVAIGGTAPNEPSPTMTADEYARTLGRRARIAGFLAWARTQEPSRRTAAEWRAAMTEHMARPVR